MAKYLITGGKKLSGQITISGNKNSVFPCLAASLLTDDEVILENVPDIVDTGVSIQILQSIGSKIEYKDHTLKITTPKITTTTLPKSLTSKLRGSVLFAGGILGREGRVGFFHPGGDVIGKRSIGVHLLGFESLGFKVKNSDLEYKVSKDRDIKSVDYFLEEASVTATENLILASVLKKGQTILKNCAREPHVVDLCKMLFLMGADIKGIGDSKIEINGVSKLHGITFSLGPDFLEFGAYAIAAALTKGSIKLLNCPLDNLEPITIPLQKMGLIFDKNPNNSIRVSAKNIKPIPKLITNIWPGFPTDLMSLFIILATQAKGVSLMHDWMYESRMFFVDKLISMGANITIADPHRVVIYGPSKLFSRDLETPDIRAGMSLVLAALIAQGKSTINRAELIERGYEDVANNLARLGADIKRLD